MIDLLARLIACRTANPGGDERALAELLADELRKRNPDEVVVADAPGGHAYTFARWGAPSLLINAHLDTVPPNSGWSSDPFVARVDGGEVFGLGSADTKGAIAATLAALDAAPPRRLAVLFSGDEEVGGSCVRAFLAGPHARGLHHAIVCEPTRCRAGTRHRGVVALEARLAGEGGHSSRADRMPAPIAELARLALAWYDWGRARRDAGPPGFPGMCTNIARLEGGIAFNVVPSQAALTASWRPPPGVDVTAVAGELRALAAQVAPEAQLTTALANDSFTTRALEDFRPWLGDVVDAPVDLGFWTEAAVLSAAGVDAVVLGPGDIGHAHAPDEHVPIADLERARDLYAAAISGA